MSTIEMWFDGGGPYGFGNVRRSRELGEALIRRGHEVRFVPLSERAEALLGRAPDERGRAGVVVLDVPYAGDEAVRAARARGAKIVALDFDGAEPPDLVISLQAVRRVPAGCRSLCGPEYAIIREEIRSLGTKHETNDEVLVVVGGGDQEGLAARIVERLPGVRICVVQGPAGGVLEIDRKDLSIVTNPPDLPQRMARCTWAVTTGGTTMLEMLCLGKAIHVVPRTEAEQVFAQRFAGQSALLGLGLDTLRVPALQQIAACEERGPRLVDGRGCERIAIGIETLP